MKQRWWTPNRKKTLYWSDISRQLLWENWDPSVCNRLQKVSSGRCTVLGCDVLGGAASRLAMPIDLVRQELHSLEAVAERRMMNRMNTVLNCPSLSVDDELWQMDSTFRHQLIPPKSETVRFRRSLVPTAIRRYHSNCDHSLSQLWPPPPPPPHPTYSHSARPVTLTALISNCSNIQTVEIDFFYLCWTMVLPLLYLLVSYLYYC